MNKVYATYELEYPFEYGSEKITALDLCRPNAGILKSIKFENFNIAEQANLLSKIVSIPNSDLSVSPKLIDAIDGYDFMKMGELIASWFPKPASN